MDGRERIEKAREAVDLVHLAGRDTKLNGSSHIGFRGCCPLHGGDNPTGFRLTWSGDHWRFRCYACDAHGDVLDYLAASRGLTLPQALEWCVGPPDKRDFQPIIKTRKPRGGDRDQAKASRIRAGTIWKAAKPAAGTIVEAYFTARGIDPAFAAWREFRFSDRLKYWIEPRRHGDPPRLLHEGPALVSRLSDPNGAGVAVHCTFLAHDGAGKVELENPDDGSRLNARKMHGAAFGGILLLTDPRSTMLVGEGLESVASVLSAAYGDGAAGATVFGEATGALAACSLGNFSGDAAPRSLGPKKPDGRGHYPSPRSDPTGRGYWLPAGTRRVLALRDNDSAEKHRVRHEQQFLRACDRAARLGASVTPILPPDGMDGNDWVLAARPALALEPTGEPS